MGLSKLWASHALIENVHPKAWLLAPQQAARSGSIPQSKYDKNSAGEHHKAQFNSHQLEGIWRASADWNINPCPSHFVHDWIRHEPSSTTSSHQQGKPIPPHPAVPIVIKKTYHQQSSSSSIKQYITIPKLPPAQPWSSTSLPNSLVMVNSLDVAVEKKHV